MSSELSRSLVDAAAEAMYLAWHHSVPFEDQAADVRADYLTASPPVVAAVLETLAAGATHFSDSLTLHKHQREALRRLATEVSAAPDGQ